jgi:dephospho-CoA kinase
LNCNEENQLERLKNRADINEKQAKTMIFAQISQQDRMKIAKEMPCNIIENNGTLAELTQQAGELHQKLINL